MKKTLIKNARVVNEGNIKKRDILIDGDIILKISKSINVNTTDINIIEADNNYLIPGLIDDQVHFREPGLTQSNYRNRIKSSSSRGYYFLYRNAQHCSTKHYNSKA